MVSLKTPSLCVTLLLELPESQKGIPLLLMPESNENRVQGPGEFLPHFGSVQSFLLLQLFSKLGIVGHLESEQQIPT